MEERIFDLQASPKMMQAIRSLALEQGLEVSEPMATASVADALDAPLGVDEARQVLEVITLAATTGTTVVGFIAALKSLLSVSEEEDGSEPKVRIIDTLSQDCLGEISAKSGPDKV